MQWRAAIFGATAFLALTACRERSESAGAKAQSSVEVSNTKPNASVKPAVAPAVTRVDPPAGASAEAPNLFLSTNGALLTWIENTQGKKIVRFARFSQVRWSNVSTVVESDELFVNWADVPAIAEAGGRIFVVFPERSKGAQGYRSEIAVSSDGGLSFQRRGPLHSDTSDTEHGFVTFTPERVNAVRAFWLDGRAMAKPPIQPDGLRPPMRLYTAVVGESVTDEVLLDERTCDCCNLGAGRSDKGAIVAYRDRNGDEVRDIAVVRAEDQGFSKPINLHEDGYRVAGCPVNGPALAADGSRVAITWYTYAKEEGRVKIAFSIDAGIHFSEPLTVGDSNGAASPLGRVAITWADHGDAITGYVEAERERARIVLRRANPDGSLFAPFTVAETRPERKSGFPKMVRLDDQLLVVWTEAESPSQLRASLVPLAAVPREKVTTAPNAPRDEHIVDVGKLAPAFNVQTIDGKSISLQSLAGKPVLVNLWASYCEPCRQELPLLSKLYNKYKKRGLEMVGIAMDERASGATMEQLVKKRHIEYPIWLDPEDRAGRAFGVRILPATFLIDAKGTVVLVRKGAMREDDAELEKAIEKELERKQH